MPAPKQSAQIIPETQAKQEHLASKQFASKVAHSVVGVRILSVRSMGSDLQHLAVVADKAKEATFRPRQRHGTPRVTPGRRRRQAVPLEAAAAGAQEPTKKTCRTTLPQTHTV